MVLPNAPQARCKEITLLDTPYEEKHNGRTSSKVSEDGEGGGGSQPDRNRQPTLRSRRRAPSRIAASCRERDAVDDVGRGLCDEEGIPTTVSSATVSRATASIAKVYSLGEGSVRENPGAGRAFKNARSRARRALMRPKRWVGRGAVRRGGGW